MWHWIFANSLVSLAIVLIGLALHRLGRQRPASLHILWLLALIVLVLPPWPLLPTSGGDAAGSRTWLSVLGDRLISTPSPAPVADAIEMATYGESMGESSESQEPPIPIGYDATAPTSWSAGGDEASEAKKPSESSVVVRPQTEATPVWEPTAGLVTAETAARADDIATLIWLVGSALLGLSFAVGTLRLRFRLRAARRAPKELQDRVRLTSSRFGIEAPRVRLATGLGAPFVWSGGPAQLVWPATRDGALAVPVDAGIVAHELAHLKRRDHWVAWLELVTTTLLWWHPLVWVIRARLRHYSEMAADAWVVWAFPEGRRDYAVSLIDAAAELPRSGRMTPALGALDSSARSFRSRLEVILRGETAARVVSPVVGLAALAALLVIAPMRSVRGVVPAESAPIGLATVVETAVRRAAQRRLIDYHLARQDWGAAVPLIAAASDAGSGDAGRFLHLLGYGSIVLGEREQALTAFTRQIEAGYRPATAQYNIACSLSLLGRVDDAFPHLERALAAGFLDPTLMAQDTDLDALRVDPRFQVLLDKARRTQEHHATVQRLLTSATPSSSDVEAALAALALAEADMPEAANRYRQYGFWLLRVGAFEPARERFQRCLDLSPTFDEIARYGLACARHQQTNSTVAWRELIRSRWLGLDLDSIASDDVDVAWKDLASDDRLKAARRNAPSALSLWSTAQAALQRRDWEAARVQLGRLVKVNPESAPAWEQLGVAALHAGDSAAARAAHHEQIERGYAVERALVQLARIAVQECAFDRAFALLHRALDLGAPSLTRTVEDPLLAKLWTDPRWDSYRIRATRLAEATASQ